jgi:pimeloyl-ACP methyl ester carboxylesterase
MAASARSRCSARSCCCSQKAGRFVAIELQAHGRTADIDRPLSFESIADDVAVIDHLGFKEVDLMGHSLGGVALTNHHLAP